MSVRPLNDDSSGEPKQETIWNVARTKGIEDEIEHIESERDQTGDGDTVVYYRVYTDVVRDESGSIDEVNSVGAQITDFVDVDEGPNVFRQRVSKTLSEIKAQFTDVSDEQDELERLAEQDDRNSESTDTDTSSDTSTTASSETTTQAPVPVETNGDTVGSQLDARLADHEQRLADIEDRLDELDDTLKALEGLSELVGDSE